MQEESRTEMKILAVLQQENLILVSGKMVSGDVYGERYLSCLETGGKWEVNAKAFSNFENGVRLIGLEHVEGSNDLKIDFTLISA